MMLIDGEQRERATNPSASFIVQAPAGSGKTEILTQRYLRLLSTVTAPEHIVALTFTRKAANEMRERIILALQKAAANEPATSPHQQNTLNYAHSALAQDCLHQWHLLQHPNRLRINTIDSLCQSINQAIPLLEQQIGYAQITDKARHYYTNAARQCIHFAMDSKDYQEAIKILLIHVDNRQDNLVTLFTDLLAQRDQWLAPLFQARTQDKEVFERALAYIEHHELERFKKSLPLELAYQLTTLAHELIAVENNPSSPRAPLHAWTHFKDTTPELAQALCHLILASDGAIRKGFDHHVGLKKGACPATQYQRIKEDSKILLAQLSDYPDFLVALKKISQLPKPEYDSEQWEVLQALFKILPLLVSLLHVLFKENNEVDFTTIAQHALTALGTPDAPTDLALYLDHSIHHLLVDEFQDTSLGQFALLTQLVEGWDGQDGKTLFIVGDPMQSIYRFRQAEVGLFFRAKAYGIGPVALQSLQLQCNFRSHAPIVDWVNQHFSYLFPQEIDIESGAVNFHPSVPVRPETPSSEVVAVEFACREEEAQYLINSIRHEQELRPEQTIAILVRSRSQLPAIINLLRLHNIPYQGTDITLLSHLSHLQDAWSLTQALLMPANRLSWLSCLRSPYCGLSLSDLHAIAQYNPEKSIALALLHLDEIQGLSEEGLVRARFFSHVMHKALAQRGHAHLSEWIHATLKKLYLDTLLNHQQKSDLEQFWTLLDRYEEYGRLGSLNEFLSELNNLYAQHSVPSKVQIMTIHKSKGLEFDTVFLPSLGAQASRGDNPLVRWLKLPTVQEDIFLMSPLKAVHQEHCPLYDYLTSLDDEKSFYESQRVLYVAVTRAKNRLYLLDGSGKTTKKSFRGLLKKQEFTPFTGNVSQEEKTPELPPLHRLPTDYYTTLPLALNETGNRMTELSGSTAHLTGVVLHRMLQWICDRHPKDVNEVPLHLAEQDLVLYGLDKQALVQAMANIRTQLNNLFKDPIGLWIIAPHDQEHNEYEVLVKKDNNLVTRIIDRTFEEENVLWIIDFKTGQENEQSKEHYKKQLNEYASYLRASSSLPIRCGLYYLANSQWDCW